MALRETIIMLAQTTAGFAVVLGLWLLFQAVVRRQNGCGRDKDPLDYMPNGCAGCKNSGVCRRRKEEHHELA